MTTDQQKLSLAGSVSLGTGVMIGAGIFALVGQVSELAGPRMPLAFLADTNPSSGGIAMLLKGAYGPGVVAEMLAGCPRRDRRVQSAVALPAR